VLKNRFNISIKLMD